MNFSSVSEADAPRGACQLASSARARWRRGALSFLASLVGGRLGRMRNRKPANIIDLPGQQRRGLSAGAPTRLPADGQKIGGDGRSVIIGAMI